METKKTNIKQMIRLGGADLDGNRAIYHALRKIKGVSYAFSNAICNKLKFDKKKKIGELNDADIKKVEELLKDPKKFDLAAWVYNRQKDYDSGDDKHLISSDLKLRKDFDIKRLRMIKSYRGVRHGFGLPLRGQRTKSHFRKGATVGVSKKGAKGKKK